VSDVVTVVLVATVAVVTGCATCPRSGRQGALLLEVAHVEGGEGPLIDQLRVYESGVLELEHVGEATRCAPADSAPVSELRAYLISEQFTQLARQLTTQGRRCCDREEAAVRYGGNAFFVAIDEIPEGLRPLFTTLDALYRDAFGRAYSMPFIRK